MIVDKRVYVFCDPSCGTTNWKHKYLSYLSSGAENTSIKNGEWPF